MKHQETIGEMIVKNVNRALEVIPRAINGEAEVIKLNFQKPRKTKRARRPRKPKPAKPCA